MNISHLLLSQMKKSIICASQKIKVSGICHLAKKRRKNLELLESEKRQIQLSKQEPGRCLKPLHPPKFMLSASRKALLFNAKTLLLRHQSLRRSIVSG